MIIKDNINKKCNILIFRQNIKNNDNKKYYYYDFVNGVNLSELLQKKDKMIEFSIVSVDQWGNERDNKRDNNDNDNDNNNNNNESDNKSDNNDSNNDNNNNNNNNDNNNGNNNDNSNNDNRKYAILCKPHYLNSNK